MVAGRKRKRDRTKKGRGRGTEERERGARTRTLTGPFGNVTLHNCFRPHSRPEVPFHSWIGHNGGFTRLLRTPASRHASSRSPLSPPFPLALPPIRHVSFSLSLFTLRSPCPLRSFSLSSSVALAPTCSLLSLSLCRPPPPPLRLCYRS